MSTNCSDPDRLETRAAREKRINLEAKRRGSLTRIEGENIRREVEESNLRVSSRKRIFSSREDAEQHAAEVAAKKQKMNEQRQQELLDMADAAAEKAVSKFNAAITNTVKIAVQTELTEIRENLTTEVNGMTQKVDDALEKLGREQQKLQNIVREAESVRAGTRYAEMASRPSQPARRPGDEGVAAGPAPAMSEAEEVKQHLSVARRSVGMGPIGDGDIEHWKNQGALNPLHAAIKEFMQMELGVSNPRVLRECNIISAQPPASGTNDWLCYNVTFEREDTARACLQGRGYMKALNNREGSRARFCRNYVPPQIFPRYKMASEIERGLYWDEAEGGKTDTRTRLTFGTTDIILEKQTPGRHWEYVELPEEPPLIVRGTPVTRSAAGASSRPNRNPGNDLGGT